jgi:integrase
MSITHRTRRGPDGSIVRDETSWTIQVAAGGGRRITRTFKGARRDAERVERDLRAAVQAGRWAEIDRTRQRAIVHLEQIAGAWIEAGMPKPGGRARTPDQRRRLQAFLTPALSWWGSRSPAGIGPRDFEAFGQHKRAGARSGTGERQADLELVALHQCCTWAVSAGRMPSNPFANRPTYRDAAAVQHCSSAMPASDEELHLLLGRLMASQDLEEVVVGAHLMFSALTGLRPGEPGALRWDASGDQPGARLTILRDGKAVNLLRVQRSKGGINPAVRLHPVLEEFLGAWRAWTAQHAPKSQWMFPHPTDPTRPLVPFGATAESHLARTLKDAAAGLRLPARRPHSMRAYYVRVRRSQGIDDATIAVELGQGSGPGLVVRTYGERLAILGGDGLYDWLPGDSKLVAWSTLAAKAPANVVPMAA